MTGPGPLDGFAVLARLSPGQRAAVAQAAREVSFPAGAVLFAEGGPAARCWLIRDGRVALETRVPGRAPVVVHTLGPGDLVGWSWLIPPHQWQYTAVARGAVLAAELDAARLRALADADPALGYPLALGLLEAATARLQSTRPRLLDLYGSPRDR
jgi:CRP-like cAMP-binding protein